MTLEVEGSICDPPPPPPLTSDGRSPPPTVHSSRLHSLFLCHSSVPGYVSSSLLFFCFVFFFPSLHLPADRSCYLSPVLFFCFGCCVSSRLSSFLVFFFWSIGIFFPLFSTLLLLVSIGIFAPLITLHHSRGLLIPFFFSLCLFFFIIFREFSACELTSFFFFVLSLLIDFNPRKKKRTGTTISGGCSPAGELCVLVRRLDDSRFCISRRRC